MEEVVKHLIQQFVDIQLKDVLRHLYETYKDHINMTYEEFEKTYLNKL